MSVTNLTAMALRRTIANLKKNHSATLSSTLAKSEATPQVQRRQLVLTGAPVALGRTRHLIPRKLARWMVRATLMTSPWTMASRTSMMTMISSEQPLQLYHRAIINQLVKESKHSAALYDRCAYSLMRQNFYISQCEKRESG